MYGNSSQLVAHSQRFEHVIYLSRLLPATHFESMGCKQPLAAATGAYILSVPGVSAFIASTSVHGYRLVPTAVSYPRWVDRQGVAFPRRACRQRLCSAHTMANIEGESSRKKVVFLGTPEVAASSLELLLQASRQGKGGAFDIVRAVSNPPARAGRKKVLQPCPVQALAESEGVSVMTPTSAKDKSFLEELEELGPDLCITAAYGQFLPRRFLEIPKFGTLNVHPSLLPRYRGASPVQRCLEAGEPETGVTVAFTVLKMDAGPVVRQKVRSLTGAEKTPELLKELFQQGTEELIDCLPSVWDGTMEKKPQDDAAAVKAAKISIKEARCCFKTSSATQIHNKVRAFAGWPGTWALFSRGEDGAYEEQMKIKLITTAVGQPPAAADGDKTEAPSRGERRVVLRGDVLELTCADGSILRVLELQPLNKNVMGAKAFANGLRGDEIRWVEQEAAEAVPAAG